MLTVTYPPRQEINGRGYYQGVLEDLEGCREIQCTMAETNILWVQEDFNPGIGKFRPDNSTGPALGSRPWNCSSICP